MCNMSICTYFHIVEDGWQVLLGCVKEPVLLVFAKTISHNKERERKDEGW